MVLAIATLTLFAQRSQAEIEARRSKSSYFTPAMERMMRATDAQLIVYAGSLKPDERGPAVDEIVARKLKSSAPTLLTYLAPKVSDTILKGRLQGLIVTALGRLGNPVAIPALRKQLKGGFAGVRVASAFALGDLNDRASAADMRAAFPLMKEPMLIYFIRKFGDFGDKASEPSVRSYLEKARYNQLRMASAEALGKIGNREHSVPALIVALKDDYPDVRWAAANALAKLGDPRAIPALKKALAEESPQASNAPNMERRSKEAIKDALTTLGAG